MRILLIFSLLCVNANSEGLADQSELHLYAHSGVSYALTMVTYGLAKKVFHLADNEKYEALILAIVTSTMLGIMRQVVVTPNGVPVNTTSLGYNAIGNGLAGITILMFDF